MSNLSKIFSETQVQIPNKSGFDMSHITSGTLKTGQLIPALCEPLLPGDKVSLGALAEINFAPFASQPYGKVDLCMEAFFVPYRILWGGWESFITMPANNPFTGDVIRPTSLPTITLTNNKNADFAIRNTKFGNGSLADYLGVNGGSQVQYGETDDLNAMPFLAYHKIYDDWYRNSTIQKPVFAKTAGGQRTAKNICWDGNSMDFSYVRASGDTTGDYTLQNATNMKFGDGSEITQLRQRNWGKDYFTTCAMYPQANGDIVGSSVVTPVNGGKTSTSIAAIRSANTLQKWLERNNVAGARYVEQIRATYGVTPSDAALSRPIFLGSTRTPIYTKGVETNSSTSDYSSGNNPFEGQVGNKAGAALGVSSGALVDTFEAKEHGYLMVLISVVPHATYASGIRRYLLDTSVGSIPNPLLQGLGEQAVYNEELMGFVSDEFKRGTFGYQPQYSHYKYHNDELHGELRDGMSLESFAIQRTFDDSLVLGSDFLTIKPDALDQITAVNSNVANLTAWYNIGFEFKKISTLSEYLIPTLDGHYNTHTESIPNRGIQL